MYLYTTKTLEQHSTIELYLFHFGVYGVDEPEKKWNNVERLASISFNLDKDYIRHQRNSQDKQATVAAQRLSSSNLSDSLNKACCWCLKMKCWCQNIPQFKCIWLWSLHSNANKEFIVAATSFYTGLPPVVEVEASSLLVAIQWVIDQGFQNVTLNLTANISVTIYIMDYG